MDIEKIFFRFNFKHFMPERLGVVGVGHLSRDSQECQLAGLCIKLETTQSISFTYHNGNYSYFKMF